MLTCSSNVVNPRGVTWSGNYNKKCDTEGSEKQTSLGIQFVWVSSALDLEESIIQFAYKTFEI